MDKDWGEGEGRKVMSLGEKMEERNQKQHI